MEHISSSSYPPRLERPIDMYTSGELEHALLLWNSADVGWQRDDKRPARERVFAANQPEIIHLIKGGRWLLGTSDRTGSVTYYDLDAQNIVGVPLIPDQIPDCGSQNAPHGYRLSRRIADAQLYDCSIPCRSFRGHTIARAAFL